jgi:hypothetical protein
MNLAPPSIKPTFSPTTHWLCKISIVVNSDGLAYGDRPRSPYNDFNLKIRGFKVALSWLNNQWFKIWLCDYQWWRFEHPHGLFTYLMISLSITTMVSPWRKFLSFTWPYFIHSCWSESHNRVQISPL